MPTRIEDEFTNLPISREAKRRKRKFKAGFCVESGCKARRDGDCFKCRRHLRISAKIAEKKRKARAAAQAEAPVVA